jgi:hypothetical protein
VINHEYAVHSLANGIGTSDPTLTRDWLTENLLGVSEFGKDLGSNFTSLVRSNMAVDDKVNKAWFITPGYKWATPSGATAQSALQLSDKLIAIAIVTLNDGDGAPVSRRLLTLETGAGNKGGMKGGGTVFKTLSSHDIGPSGVVASADPSASPFKKRRAVVSRRSSRRNLVKSPETDSDKIREALSNIAQTPRSGLVPPISYDVNVGRQIANILDIKDDKWGMVDLSLTGRFPSTVGMDEVTDTVAARLKRNMGRFCPTCSGLFPVFYNMKKDSTGMATGGRRRALLQANPGSAVFDGKVSVMLSYEQDKNNIVFSELFRSVIDQSYSDVWTGELSGRNLDDYVAHMQNEQFVLHDITRVWDDHNTTNIIMDMSNQGSAASWTQDTGVSSLPMLPQAQTDIDVNDFLALEGVVREGNSTSGTGRIHRDYTIITLIFLAINAIISMQN